MNFQPSPRNVGQVQQQMQQQVGQAYQPYRPTPNNMSHGPIGNYGSQVGNYGSQFGKMPNWGSVDTGGIGDGSGLQNPIRQTPGMQQTPGGQQMSGNMLQAWRPNLPQGWQNNIGFMQPGMQHNTLIGYPGQNQATQDAMNRANSAFNQQNPGPQGWQPLGQPQQQQQQQPQQQPQRPPPAQRLMNPTDRQQGRLDYLKSQGRESQNNFAQAKDPYGQVNPRQQQRLDYLQSQGREPGANFGRMGNGSKMRTRARMAKGQGGQGIMSQPPMMEGA